MGVNQSINIIVKLLIKLLDSFYSHATIQAMQATKKIFLMTALPIFGGAFSVLGFAPYYFIQPLSLHSSPCCTVGSSATQPNKRHSAA